MAVRELMGGAGKRRNVTASCRWEEMNTVGHDSSLFRSVINFIGLQLLSSNDKIIFGVWHLFNEKILKR